MEPAYQRKVYDNIKTAGKAFGIVPLGPMFFAHLNDLDKFAPCVCPAAQMDNIRILIQVIIAGKVITLNVAVVIV